MSATTIDMTFTGKSTEEESAGIGGRTTSRRIDSEVIARLQKVFDATIIFTIGLASYIEIAGAWDRFELLRGIIIAALGAFVFLNVTREIGGYDVPRLKSSAGQLARASAACFATATIAGIAALITGMAGPWVNVWVAGWLALILGLVSVQRFVLSVALNRLSRAGRLAHRVALIGSPGDVAAAIEKLKANGPEEVDVCGFFDDRDEDRAGGDVVGVPKLGNIDDLVEFTRWFRIDTIIVTLPMTAETRLLQLLRKLWGIPADIRISALGSKLRLNRRTYSKIGELPLLDTFDRPISSWNRLIKSTFDRCAAVLAIIALSPVMAATAIAIRLESPGPVLFRQRRYGFNNELIEIYKFRSMKVESADADASRLVTRDDNRVTAVGRFIRKTSIDELPQLFNVLNGDLSLVGPRPHALKAKAADALYQSVVHDYLARHRVKPGVTGWAQIKGWRGETDTHEKIERRVECDLYYIDHWSIWLDLYILAATPLALFNTKHAF